MLEKILKLYTMALATGATSPLPHLFGPPGSGKSSVVKEAADLIGVTLHTINLSRVSPLELEGVQMPITEEEMRLKLLHATYWTQLKEGDILLFDEFLRAFPEVMNGLLDIITAREVGGLRLPDVFIIAASNSVIAYDKALEDRLLHLPVPDPRKKKSERDRIAKLLVDRLGLLPMMTSSDEMDALMHDEVLPMYEMLDQLDKRSTPAVVKGSSIRRLIGQAQLREVTSRTLADLISVNNGLAAANNRWQHVFLLDGKHVPHGYDPASIVDSPKLTPTQRLNTQLNMQLIELAELDRSNPEEGDAP